MNAACHVTCPFCRAPHGMPCRTVSGRRARAHRARTVALRRRVNRERRPPSELRAGAEEAARDELRARIVAAWVEGDVAGAEVLARQLWSGAPLVVWQDRS